MLSAASSLFSSKVNLRAAYRLVYKQYLHTMRLSTIQMKSVLSPGVKQLADLFSKHGYELRIAGGAVRDLLSGKTPHDLDFATTATPDEMKTMFMAEDVRILNAGGEKHGTVTPRLQEMNFECTTLRIDVETDGRHAKVEFTKNWQMDANRRDLTINSMFLGLDGTVYDYFDGIKHLQEKKVIFVGDANKRIKEDYLRILRYFRFYGRIADDPDSHNPEVLEIIKKNAEGLGKISGERIWVEVKKIVNGRFGGELIIKMVECGVGQYIGFPETFNCVNCRQLYNRLEDVNIPLSAMHEMTLLAPGFSSEEECTRFIARIKCSKREREVMWYVVVYRDMFEQAESFKEIEDHIVDLVIGKKMYNKLAFFFVRELLKYTCKLEFLCLLDDWKIPEFPVKAVMIIEKGVPRKKTKVALRDLLKEWKQSNFTMSCEELLSKIDVERYSS